MTNQEAINYLLDPLSLPESMDIKDKLRWHEDAVNMAIEALKAYEVKNSTQEVKNSTQEVENPSDGQSVMICGACDNSESAELYLTNPPQIKCKRSGKLHFVTDRCDLPSAEPEPIRINLNEPIKVKLTDWGKEIYYHQYDRTNQIAGREIFKPRFPRKDENGYTKFQLWYFIELYGMHMGMTLPNVIEPLEIVYER